jgi:hypothetical protein
VATEAPAAHPGGGVGEDTDAARSDALDEGQRRQRERDDIERKAAALQREAEQSAAVRQQYVRGMERAPQRESGQRGSRVVLAQVRDVRQRGRRKGEQERDGRLSIQRRLVSPPRDHCTTMISGEEGET